MFYRNLLHVAVEFNFSV